MRLPPVIAAAIQAGDTVIASSARAARALRRLYGEAQRSKGLEAWQSPDILDWDSWLNGLWQKRLRSGSETRLLLTTLQEQQVWVRLIRPRIEGRQLISVLGVAELAQQAYALLCAYRALDFLRGEGLAGPDVENFREWARDFERVCRQENWLSRGMLPLVLHDAVLAGQVEATPRLVLTGFDRITPVQRHLFDAFQEQSGQVDTAEADEVSTIDTTLLVEAVDKRDEIFTCAQWVRQQFSAATAARPRIAIVAPSVSSMRPEIEGIFRLVLAPETVAIRTRDLPLPFEFSLGVPLADMPMARAALLLLAWMNKALAQEDLSWLILSGFVCEQEDELLPMAGLDARLRRLPMRQPEQDLDTFLRFLSEAGPEATPLAAFRRRLLASKRLLPQNGAWMSFAEWAGLAERILETVHWPGAYLLQSEDFQVEARWSQLLDSVAALSFDGRKVNYAEFLEVTQRHAGQMIFAPESRDAPVQILGPLEAAGLTFDALWFLGADDISWPAAARPHPFLPRSLQRKHRMPHADSAADWELAQQATTRLERSAAKCVFSYPSQNADGACRPSTLLKSLTRGVKANELRASIGVGDMAGDDFPILVTDEEQAAIVPWPLEEDAGGSEILKRQAACPFQSFATKRLAARPMDETDWGLEPRERGNAVHRILHGLWEELKSLDGLMTARREERLPAIIERHVQLALQRYGKQIDAQKQRWSRAYLDAEEERIASLIDEWLGYEEKRAPFTFEGGEMKLPATVGELKLQLRVDRIDGVRGGRVIIDYKTGMVKKDAWEGTRPDEPQLLLYARQVEELKGLLLGRVRAGEVKFIGRVEDSDAVMPADGKLSRPPLSAKMLQEWQAILLELGQQFLSGEAQVDPKQYPKTCEFCPLPGLCRIAESDRANTGDDADEGDG